MSTKEVLFFLPANSPPPFQLPMDPLSFIPLHSVGEITVVRLVGGGGWVGCQWATAFALALARMALVGCNFSMFAPGLWWRPPPVRAS